MIGDEFDTVFNVDGVEGNAYLVLDDASVVRLAPGMQIVPEQVVLTDSNGLVTVSDGEQLFAFDGSSASCLVPFEASFEARSVSLDVSLNPESLELDVASELDVAALKATLLAGVEPTESFDADLLEADVVETEAMDEVAEDLPAIPDIDKPDIDMPDIDMPELDMEDEQSDGLPAGDEVAEPAFNSEPLTTQFVIQADAERLLPGSLQIPPVEMAAIEGELAQITVGGQPVSFSRQTTVDPSGEGTFTLSATVEGDAVMELVLSATQSGSDANITATLTQHQALDDLPDGGTYFNIDSGQCAIDLPIQIADTSGHWVKNAAKLRQVINEYAEPVTEDNSFDLADVASTDVDDGEMASDVETKIALASSDESEDLDASPELDMPSGLDMAPDVDAPPDIDNSLDVEEHVELTDNELTDSFDSNNPAFETATFEHGTLDNAAFESVTVESATIESATIENDTFDSDPVEAATEDVLEPDALDLAPSDELETESMALESSDDLSIESLEEDLSVAAELEEESIIDEAADESQSQSQSIEMQDPEELLTQSFDEPDESDLASVSDVGDMENEPLAAIADEDGSEHKSSEQKMVFHFVTEPVVYPDGLPVQASGFDIFLTERSEDEASKSYFGIVDDGEGEQHDVFKVQLEADGSYTFELLDEIDRAPEDSTSLVAFTLQAYALNADGDKSALICVPILITDNIPFTKSSLALSLNGSSPVSDEMDVQGDVGPSDADLLTEDAPDINALDTLDNMPADIESVGELDGTITDSDTSDDEEQPIAPKPNPIRMALNIGTNDLGEAYEEDGVLVLNGGVTLVPVDDEIGIGGTFYANGEEIAPDGDGNISLTSDMFVVKDAESEPLIFKLTNVTFLLDQEVATEMGCGTLSFDVIAEINGHEPIEQASGLNVCASGVADTPVIELMPEVADELDDLDDEIAPFDEGEDALSGLLDTEPKFEPEPEQDPELGVLPESEPEHDLDFNLEPDEELLPSFDSDTVTNLVADELSSEHGDEMDDISPMALSEDCALPMDDVEEASSSMSLDEELDLSSHPIEEAPEDISDTPDLSMENLAPETAPEREPESLLDIEPEPESELEPLPEPASELEPEPYQPDDAADVHLDSEPSTVTNTGDDERLVAFDLARVTAEFNQVTDSSAESVSFIIIDPPEGVALVVKNEDDSLTPVELSFASWQTNDEGMSVPSYSVDMTALDGQDVYIQLPEHHTEDIALQSILEALEEESRKAVDARITITLDPPAVHIASSLVDVPQGEEDSLSPSQELAEPESCMDFPEITQDDGDDLLAGEMAFSNQTEPLEDETDIAMDADISAEADPDFTEQGELLAEGGDVLEESALAVDDLAVDAVNLEETGAIDEASCIEASSIEGMDDDIDITAELPVDEEGGVAQEHDVVEMAFTEDVSEIEPEIPDEEISPSEDSDVHAFASEPEELDPEKSEPEGSDPESIGAAGDGTTNIIRGFEPGIGILDISDAFNAASALTFTELANRLDIQTVGADTCIQVLDESSEPIQNFIVEGKTLTDLLGMDETGLTQDEILESMMMSGQLVVFNPATTQLGAEDADELTQCDDVGSEASDDKPDLTGLLPSSITGSSSVAELLDYIRPEVAEDGRLILHISRTAGGMEAQDIVLQDLALEDLGLSCGATGTQILDELVQKQALKLD